MKKTIIVFLLLVIVGFVYAQGTGTAAASEPKGDIRSWETYPYSLGGGLEFGLNSREYFTLGYSAMIDRYLYNPHTALVLRGTMYDDFKTITASEAELALRLYVLETGNGLFFAQLGFGAAFYREEERQVNTYIMNFIAGYRYYVQTGFFRGFYLEPALRVGYPFEWGIGIFAGHWFSF